MRVRRRASTCLGTSAGMLAAAAAFACAAPERPRDTIVIASGADLESANPLVTTHALARQIQRHALFVTLARLGERLEAQPYLALRWTLSDDRRRLTLTLLRGLRWHDGQPTTAHDARFTLDAARDPASGYPRYADLAGISAVHAPDDTTLVIDYAVPIPGFPMVLCELPVVPAHLLGAVPRAELRRAAFNLRPVGNGPFRFERRDAGARWLFVRNEAFPASLGGPPRAARLVVAVVDEPSTKFAGLVSGELDMAGIAPTMAGLVARDPSLRVLEYPVAVSYALVFNARHAVLADARVRRAVSLSLDRQRLVGVALAGYATPASGPVSADNPLALAAGAPGRDSARADSLLDAAGWRRAGAGPRARNGVPLRLVLLTVGSGDNALEQLIQADLADRGIALEIRSLEMSTFLSLARAREKRFDLLITGIPGDLTLAHLASMYDSRLAGGALDFGGYHTPALDSAFARVRGAGSEEAVRDAWLTVQRLLARDMPAAWLYHARGVQGVSRRLAGVRMDLRGELVTIVRWQDRRDSLASVAAR